jgi:hypothetical protein
VVGDETCIHFIEECTRKKTDLRAFHCWAFCKDPFRIPQTVFMSLICVDFDGRGEHINNPSYIARPRNGRNAHVFRLLIHLEVVEDVMFYHHLWEELHADGKVPWRDFSWQLGKPNGKLDDEELPPLTRFCAPPSDHHWRPREDDENDREPRQSRPRGILKRVSSWMESHGTSRGRSEGAYQGSAWFGGGDLLAAETSFPRGRNAVLRSRWMM